MINSAQEKALFEAFKWDQDLIGRAWVAPNGFRLTYDTVMDFGCSLEGEVELISTMQKFGKYDEAVLARLIWDNQAPVGFMLPCGCKEDGSPEGIICSKHKAMFDV